jgi:hypothetical protein
VRQSVLVPIRERLRDRTLTPAQRISAFLEYGGKIAAETPGAMLLPIVVSIEFAGTNSPAEQRVKAGYRKVAEEVQRVLEEGQAISEFRADLRAEAMARALIATNDGLMLECLRSGLEIQVEELVATLNGMIRAGISRETPTYGTSKAHPKASAMPIRVIDVLRARLQGSRKASTSEMIP